MTRLIKIQDDDDGDGNVFRGWDGWAERSRRQPIIIQMVSLIARLILSPTSDSIPTSVVLIWHTRAPAAFYDWLPFWCQHHQTQPDVTTPDQKPILMQLVRLNLACSSNIKASLSRCLFVFSLYLGLWLDCQYRGSLGAGKHFNSLSSHLIRCNSLHQNKFSSWGCSWSFAFWWNWKGSCKLETGPGTGRLNICPDRQYQTILPFSSHSNEYCESSKIKWIISPVVFKYLTSHDHLFGKCLGNLIQICICFNKKLAFIYDAPLTVASLVRPLCKL